MLGVSGSLAIKSAMTAPIGAFSDKVMEYVVGLKAGGSSFSLPTTISTK